MKDVVNFYHIGNNMTDNPLLAYLAQIIVLIDRQRTETHDH